jgi:CheY-like chemotaxis protein
LVYHGAVKRIVVIPAGALADVVAAPAFRRAALLSQSADDADEAIAAADDVPPAVVVVDGQRPGPDPLLLCRRQRREPGWGAVRLLVILPPALAAGPQAEALAAAGCDAVLAGPLSPEQLTQHLARLVDLPQHVARRKTGSLPVTVRLAEQHADPVSGRRSFFRLARRSALGKGTRGEFAGRAVDVSETGARLVLDRAHSFRPGDSVLLTFALEGQRIHVDATVAWIGEETVTDEFSLGVKFDDPDPVELGELASALAWEVHRLPTGCRVVLHDDILPGLRYDILLNVLHGHVDFDVAEARFLHPEGVTGWAAFLRQLDRVDSVAFTRCSLAFLEQAVRTPELLGGGRIESFCVLTTCKRCSWQEELLVRTTALSTLDELGAAPGKCPRCGEATQTDEVPAPIRAFLLSAAGPRDGNRKPPAP